MKIYNKYIFIIIILLSCISSFYFLQAPISLGDHYTNLERTQINYSLLTFYFFCFFTFFFVLINIIYAFIFFIYIFFKKIYHKF